jgi:hypothetical protein
MPNYKPESEQESRCTQNPRLLLRAQNIEIGTSKAWKKLFAPYQLPEPTIKTMLRFFNKN